MARPVSDWGKRAARAASAWLVLCGAAGWSMACTAAPAKLLYAAMTSRGQVDVYDGTLKKPVTPLYSFFLNPGTMSSLAVDKAGDLFFADGYSTVTLEYAPGATTPTKQFYTTGSPSYVALHGTSLYVFQAAPSGGNAGVTIFKDGSTHASATLTDPAMLYPQGLAVDGAGNVFVGWGGANFSNGVGEFAGGQMPMQVLPVPKMDPLTMAIDPAGNLVIDAIALPGENNSTMWIFPPGQTKGGKRIKNLPWFYQFSFSADGKSFYAGDEESRAFQKYSYPGGKRIYDFKESEARWGFSGIAPAPAAHVGVW